MPCRKRRLSDRIDQGRGSGACRSGAEGGPGLRPDHRRSGGNRRGDLRRYHRGGVRGISGQREIDVSGRVLVPGFIDTHLHVESSLVTPHEFDRCVTPARGDDGDLRSARDCQCLRGAGDPLFPGLRGAAGDGPAGAAVSPACPRPTWRRPARGWGRRTWCRSWTIPKVIGLAEFMNYPGVLMKDAGCLEKLEAFQGRHIDGHAPLLRGKDLNGYISAGIRTEHEATTYDEGLEKLRKGMRVLIREGSVSKDLHALAGLLTERFSPYLCLCTDDRNPLDIGEHGHLDYMIRTAIALGAAPLAVYRAASLECGRGVRAEGPRADRAGQAGGYRGDRYAGGVPCLAGAGGGRGGRDAAFAARGDVEPVARRSVKAPPVTAGSFPDRGEPGGDAGDRHPAGQDHHRASDV